MQITTLDIEPEPLTFYLDGDESRPQIVHLIQMEQGERVRVKLCDLLILEFTSQNIAFHLHASPGPLPTPCTMVRITRS